MPDIKLSIAREGKEPLHLAHDVPRALHRVLRRALPVLSKEEHQRVTACMLRDGVVSENEQLPAAALAALARAKTRPRLRYGTMRGTTSARQQNVSRRSDSNQDAWERSIDQIIGAVSDAKTASVLRDVASGKRGGMKRLAGIFATRRDAVLARRFDKTLDSRKQPHGDRAVAAVIRTLNQADDFGNKMGTVIENALRTHKFKNQAAWERLRLKTLDKARTSASHGVRGLRKTIDSLEAMTEWFRVYYPTNASLSDAAQNGFQAVRWPVAPGITVGGLVRPPKNPEAHWFVLFGGNNLSVVDNRQSLEQIAGEADVGLATFAYRGYDGSDGTPSEAALRHDAERIFARLSKQFKIAPANITLVGQSLGTTVAAPLAAALAQKGIRTHDVQLVSPPTSIEDIFYEPWLPAPWPSNARHGTIEIAEDLEMPVAIYQGHEDTLVPPVHARRLARAIPGHTRVKILKGRGHDDMWDRTSLGSAIRSFAGVDDADRA